MPDSPTITGRPRVEFPATRWSLVLRFQRESSQASDRALSELCRLYWYPIYAYLRWLGAHRDEAEDLTQGYFEKLISRQLLQDLREEKGRLRTFLALTVKRFYVDQVRRQTAQRRGGRTSFVPFEIDEADERFRAEPITALTPEHQFERRWALLLLESVMKDLEREYVERGRGDLFKRIKHLVSWNANDEPQADLAKQLGMSVGALRMSILRMRKRYGQLLSEAIAQTVASPEEVDGEIAYLFSVFQRPAA
ncbi:MAG: hypothetical protein R3F11_26110 [Verrucomicrobiales bacterium]